MDLRLKGKGPQPQQKDTLFTATMWILAVFMLISGMAFIPSAASITMILFAVIAVPIDRIQDFWASKGLRGSVKLVVLIALFAVSIVLYQPSSP